MSVVLIHQGPSLTQEKYEETVRRLAGTPLFRLDLWLWRRAYLWITTRCAAILVGDCRCRPAIWRHDIVDTRRTWRTR
jgi:hypothetical protein